MQKLRDRFRVMLPGWGAKPMACRALLDHIWTRRQMNNHHGGVVYLGGQTRREYRSTKEVLLEQLVWEAETGSLAVDPDVYFNVCCTTGVGCIGRLEPASFYPISFLAFKQAADLLLLHIPWRVWVFGFLFVPNSQVDTTGLGFGLAPACAGGTIPMSGYCPSNEVVGMQFWCIFES